MKIEKQLDYVFNEDFEFKMEIADPNGYDDPSMKTKKYFYNPQGSQSPKK